MATNNAINTSLNGQTGTGNFVGANTPTLITPVLGAATATSINFGGSTLSNYVSETTWTPTFTFATPGNLSVAYATQNGWYTRIGSVVYIIFQLTCTPTYTTASGAVVIGGLPINSSSTITPTMGTVAFSGTFVQTGGAYYSNLSFIENSAGISILQTNTGGSSNMTTSSFVSASAVTIYGSGFYFV